MDPSFRPADILHANVKYHKAYLQCFDSVCGPLVFETTMVMSQDFSSENYLIQENRRLKQQIADMIQIAHEHIFPDMDIEQVRNYFGVKTTPKNQYMVSQMNK